MATSPTKRTLDWLRADGWCCQVVEHWNPFARRRVDLFGGIDIVCVRGNETLGVQATTTDHASTRCAKLLALEPIRAWIAAGNQLWVVGWAKRGPRGKRKVWTPNVTKLELSLTAELTPSEKAG
jgi:hypothetical protein